MKLSGSWDNYYKLVGNIKFSIFNKPIKKFKFTNQIIFGNNITENNINMFYIEITIIKLKLFLHK